jgi:hypothetical protein
MIQKTVLNSNFTIKDIHKIKVRNYERLKDASAVEGFADIRSQVKPLFSQFKERRTKC